MRPIHRHPFVEDILPVVAEGPGPKNPPHPHPHPGKPCVGHGMNTDARAREYVHGFRQLQKDWGPLAVKDRMARIQSLANQQLHGHVGAPPLQMRLTPNERPYFDAANWSMNIVESVVQAPALDEANAKYLASSVYHESRHAEQTYLAARKHAADLERTGGYHPARLRQKIMNDLHISQDAADQSAAHPLHKGDPLYPCASVMYEDSFGRGAARDKRAEARVLVADKAVDDVEAEYDHAEEIANRIEAKQDALHGLPRSAGPTEMAAEEAANRARSHWGVEKYLHIQPEQDYLNLPSESDAYDTQQKVEKAWDGAPQTWFP